MTTQCNHIAERSKLLDHKIKHDIVVALFNETAATSKKYRLKERLHLLLIHILLPADLNLQYHTTHQLYRLAAVMTQHPPTRTTDRSGDCAHQRILSRLRSA